MSDTTYKASGFGGKPAPVCSTGKALSIGQPSAILEHLYAANPSYTVVNPGLAKLPTEQG